MDGAPDDSRPVVTLGGTEPACTTASIVRLSNSFFAAGGSLGSGDKQFNEAIALTAVADLSADISRGTVDIAVTSEALAGTASDFVGPLGHSITNVQHSVSAGPPDDRKTEATTVPDASVSDAAGAMVNVYGETGSLLSATVEQPGGFTVTAPDTGRGQAFSITESVDGRESAPVVVLDAGTLENAVAAAHAEFATSGAIEVENGKYLDLYNAGDVPMLDRPALVYDPSAHTIALDIPGHAPLPLIVLGASSNPSSLDASEIVVKQAS
jgi:hypothetical protein